MITKVRVRHLRSLQDVTLDLGPLTVLVGPNGAGKSSVLGAFEVVREYASRGQEALAELGKTLGPPPGRLPKQAPPFGVEIEGTIQAGTGEDRPFSYGFDVLSPWGPWVQLGHEWFRYTGAAEQRSLMEFPSHSPNAVGMIQLYKEDGSPSFGISPGGQSALSVAVQQAEENGLTHFAREVLSWQFLSPAPQYSKQSGSAKREDRLDETGTNLSAVLLSIHSEDAESFSRIINAFRATVPEVQSVRVPVTADGKTYIQVQEAGIDRPLPIWQLSDGTVSLLQLFTLLEAQNPAPLICIDEPENFVHPGLIENIVESMRHASEKARVIVATHSPFLLNYLKPEEVVIVEKSEGQTSLRRAANHEGVSEAVKLLGLGDLWKSGAIGGVP